MGVAIVAIPSEDDYVWRLSSEKVPHMTLLFLGDVTDPEELTQIENFLSHVVETSVYRFGLSVDSRGELGPDKADVLFFKKQGTKSIAAARADMLKDPSIKRAYNSTQQFPEWTPHLTLGYPATPAKADTREFPGIHWVNFDKIALWVGDYEGPEFKLQDNYIGEEVAMTITAEDILAHHGVKGMKWGVRKDGSVSSTTTRTGTLTRPATDVTARQKPGQFVRTAGGKKQTAAEDAVRVAAARQQAKKSTTDSLSNKQLQEAVTRMNLEQQYHTLVKKTDRRTRGQRLVSALLGSKGDSPIDLSKATKVAEALAAAKKAAATG